MIDKLLLDRWMGDAQGEDYIDWAVDLLVAGRDTPSLRILAGLNPTHNRGDMDGYFLRSCKELGLGPLELSDNPRDAVPLVRRLSRSGTLSPEETVHRMSRLYQLSEYSDPLLYPWFELDEALADWDRGLEPPFFRLPEEMESLEQTIDREWELFDRAVALDLPEGFERLVRCERCRHIGPTHVPFSVRLCVFLTGCAPHGVPSSVCAKCRGSRFMHMACAEVREDYFSRLHGGGESPRA